MSVVAEFTIADEEFPLGRTLRTAAEREIRLEVFVPVEGLHVPYFWVTGGEFETFERRVRSDPNVEDVTRLDRRDGEALYRVSWTETDHGLLAAIRETGGVIVEAVRSGDWRFRLRFDDRDRLEAFYQYCAEREVSLDFERVYTLDEMATEGGAFDLTPDQREALVLALERGYYSSPKETNLERLADELGISKQAVSQRLRDGNERVLREALLSPPTGIEDRQ